MTVKYQNPVRINMPVEIGPYTFTDENGAIIDLTVNFIAVSISCELKLRGQLYATIVGGIVNGPAGIVNVPSYIFTFPVTTPVTTSGIWTYQFYALNAGGQKLWGEPVQFFAVGNVEDAGLNDLLPN